MNTTIVQTENGDFYKVETEKCVICSVDTQVPRSMSIDFRKNYVEGCGQLCEKCATAHFVD